jgi:hypothetical protein
MVVPIVQVLFSVVLFLDLEVVDQFLSLPLHNLYLAGSLGGSISLCIIIGLFPHDLSCIHSFCWFAALSFSVCCWCFLSCAFAVNDACLPEPRACLVGLQSFSGVNLVLGCWVWFPHSPVPSDCSWWTLLCLISLCILLVDSSLVSYSIACVASYCSLLPLGLLALPLLSCLSCVRLVVFFEWLVAAGHDLEPSRGCCCCYLALAFWFDGGCLLVLDPLRSSGCCSVVFLPQGRGHVPTGLNCLILGCWMLLVCCKGSLCLLRGIVWGVFG